MKIVLEDNSLKLMLTNLELTHLLKENTIKGRCQLNDDDNVLTWSVESRFISGLPDLNFEDSHLRIKLPQIELSNLLEGKTDSIAHVLHPSKNELHLCVEKKSAPINVTPKEQLSTL